MKINTKVKIAVTINEKTFNVVFLDNKKVKRQIDKKYNALIEKDKAVDDAREELNMHLGAFSINATLLENEKDEDKKLKIAKEQKSIYEKMLPLKEQIKENEKDPDEIVDELEEHFKEACMLSLEGDKKEDLIVFAEEEGLEYALLFNFLKNLVQEAKKKK